MTKHSENATAAEKLAISTMLSRFRELGEDVEGSDIAPAVIRLKKCLSGASGDSGKSPRVTSGRFTMWRDLAGWGRMESEVPGGWKVDLEMDPASGACVVNVRRREKFGSWELQDTPEKGASRTLIAHVPSTSTPWPISAYVAQETHHARGRRWNPSPGLPAEIAFHSTGAVRWKRSMVDGAPKSVGDTPVFETFWDDGSPRIVEYGDSIRGKHRPVRLGPAYMEFRRGGELSVSVYAENGKMVGVPLVHSPGSTRKAKGDDGIDVPCATITDPIMFAPDSHPAPPSVRRPRLSVPTKSHRKAIPSDRRGKSV